MYSQKRNCPPSDRDRGSGTYVIAGKGMHCNKNPIYVFPEKKLRGLREGPGTHVFAGKGLHRNENPIYVFPEKKLRGL
jgi:hypothetical protein